METKQYLNIDSLLDEANSKIDHVFDALGIDVSDTQSYARDIRICCPVHGGDNPTAFSYNTELKCWKCFTHQCEEETNDSLIGLVMAIREVGFREAVDWIAQVVSFEMKSGTILQDDLDLYLKKTRIAKRIQDKFSSSSTKMKPIPLSDMKIDRGLYFQDFGFTDKTLDKFHAGVCKDRGRAMYMRAFAPVLDDNGDYIIGVTGRTLFDRCKLCRKYHRKEDGCPSDGNRYYHSKWKHWGFNAETTLYNVCNAKDEVLKTSLVVLAEGPKDVWWLDQNGIANVVGVFGRYIQEQKIKKIIEMGATRVVWCLDNDSEVDKIKNKTISILSKFFKVIDLSEKFIPRDKDIVDIEENTMKELIVPFIKKWELKYE